MILKLVTSIATALMAALLTLGWVFAVRVLGVWPWLEGTLCYLGGVVFGCLAIDAITDYWRRP